MNSKGFIIAIAVIGAGLVLQSCTSCLSKEEASPLISPYTEESEMEIVLPNTNVVDVPYTEKSDLKIVQVLINDRIKTEMIFDTGASVTQITQQEARYLIEQKLLTEDDILGKQEFTDANGNVSVDAIVKLRKLILGDNLIIFDVRACVVANGDAPLLLGQSVLKELPQYTIDNQNKVIKFKIR